LRSRKLLATRPLGVRDQTSGFNGAVTLRSRKPSPDGMPLDSLRTWRFNGAVTLRSRKPRLQRSRSLRACRFNGAVTLRSRKPGFRVSGVTLPLRGSQVLQWGRDLAVTETCHVGVEVPPSRCHQLQWGRDLAVTETSGYWVASSVSDVWAKLQWGRDLAVTETAVPTLRMRPSLPARFNGAVTLRSRKPRSDASAEPDRPPRRFNGAVTLRSRKP
jgi:hypothetical protein